MMKRIAPGNLASKAIAGFDGDGHYLIHADSDGRLLVRPYVVDIDTLELVPQQQSGSGSSGGVVTVLNWPVSQAVTGPLTNAELRAEPISVSGIFFKETQPVSGPLTDTQLRGADVKVTLDGEHVSVSNFPASQAVTGPLTDAQLRVSAVPVEDDGVRQLLWRVLTAILYPGWLDRSQNAIRSIVTSCTLAANQDIRTVTTLTNVGATFTGDMLQRATSLNAWANTQRRTIT